MWLLTAAFRALRALTQKRHDPFGDGAGLPRLADQRRGRAGRTAPGLCYRLWSSESETSLLPYNEPEIRNADLASLALELALWGVSDPGTLKWLDTPPRAAFAQARSLLADLHALDTHNKITPLGRRMASFGLHSEALRIC